MEITLRELHDKVLRVGSILDKHVDYHAHRPGDGLEGSVEAETLAEHADKVLLYARVLGEIHMLDEVISRLLEPMITPLEHGKEIANLLREMFLSTIACHDFGKVNPYFQLNQMKNGLFEGRHEELMQPRHGHSALGAFLFLTWFMEKIRKEALLQEEEKIWLSAVAMVLSGSIIDHHSPRLGKPKERVNKAIFEQPWLKWARFLELFQFEKSFVLEDLSNNSVQKHFFETIQTKDNFPLFALARLNFSLLTAADTLATSDYMKQGKVDDFGLIDAGLRGRILQNIRTSEAYNARAFDMADDPAWQPGDYSERSPENLNHLRSQMAVEVLRQVRKILSQDTEQRLFYLEAPTGGGKTNLSMLAASEILRLCPEVNKVFYVFPFTTLITQTHRSILKVLGLEETDIGLLHSKAGFREREKAFEKGQEEADSGYGKEWKNDMHLQFAHFPVCLLTHIRFFNYLKSNQKSAIYPMHRLANSIVVIDELQSYPPLEWDKILYFIEQYSRFFNIRFVLMSATLPRIDRLNISLENRASFADLLPEPQRFFQNENFRTRVSFRFDLLTEPGNEKAKRTIELPELTDVVIEKSEDYAKRHHGRVFTMIEFIFKKSATAFKVEIEKEERDRFFDEIFVLSGTILEPRRREIINYLKRNAADNRKILLITTQVVEAGVDIDMDLGFKNISLIDSDEQLAGRINRNVKKGLCEVYLFKANEPGMLYNKDLRFQITRDHIPVEEHRRILEKKDFMRLYSEVLLRVDKMNILPEIENFNSDYLPEFQDLDFGDIDKKFQLIDTDNVSIFVPMLLPLWFEGQTAGEREEVFDKKELEFLTSHGAYLSGAEQVDGREVWCLYRQLLRAEKDLEFFHKRVSKKYIQSILSKFTFSVFRSKGLEQKLLPFLGDPEESLESYWRLQDNYQEIYDYEAGLLEGKLDDPESRIF